ncbi:MAG: hypothetical protein PHI19_05070 [Clostridia bacterium]|nr:hypothetical protein [Clostridia bacterium]
MKKTMIVSFLFLFFTLLAAVWVTYAFFTASTPQNASLTGGADTETGVVQIANEYALRQHAFDRYDNGYKEVSDYEFQQVGNRGQRETLLLTADISLSYDLVIHRDCNLDLGGFTLYLNGHTLAFQHRYHGALSLSNGVLDGGTVYLDVPNALYAENNITRIETTVSGVSQTEQDLAERIFLAAAPTEEVILYDLDLMSHYYNTDISFDWSSSAPAVLSDSGTVTLPAQQTAVTLTLTIDSPSFLAPHSHNYTVTVAALSDNRLSYGVAELEAFFEHYKYSTETVYVYKDINLLRGNAYYGLSYSYTANFVAYTYPDQNREGYVYESDIVSSYVLKRNTYSRTVTLTATIDNNDNQTQDAVFTLNVVVESNLDIANNIVSNMDIYIISNIESEIELPTFTELEPYGIKQTPDYTLIGNGEGEGYYYIENGVIKVNELPESSAVTVFVRMGFTFVANSPEYVERDVQVFFVDATGVGGVNSPDRYALLYSLIDEMVTERTSGRTYADFTLPSNYLRYNIYYNIVAPQGFPQDTLTVTAYQDNTEFDIDVTAAPVTDSLITITYLFEGTDEIYSRASYFTIPGIINNDARGAPDTLLYAAMLSVYDTDEDTVLTAEEASAIQPLFAVPQSMNGTVSSYKGVEFLTGTTGFNFDGRGFTESDMQYVNQIEELETLSLKNCGLTNDNLDMLDDLNFLQQLALDGNAGITNMDNLTMSHQVETLSLADSGLTDINGLSIYPSIKTLTLTACAIKLFDALKDITDLEYVYLYNTATPVIDLYYGAKGDYNISTFTFLTNRGISVYNDYDGVAETPLLFVVDSDKAEASQVLESLFYYTYSKQQTMVRVPLYVYYGLGINDYYTIQWDYTNLAGSSHTDDGDVRIISHTANAGVYEIYGSVTVNAQTVTKVFFITVMS